MSDLAAVREFPAAWSLAEGVGLLPGGGPAAAAGHAVLLHRRRQFVRAWDIVRNLDDDVLREALPIEAVDAALAVDEPGARDRALALTADPSSFTDAGLLIDLAGRFLAFGDRGTTAELAGSIRSHQPLEVDERKRRSWRLIQDWLDRRGHDIPPGAVPVAVVDYQSPDQDLTSGNVGDYVQTLAMLANLARFSGVRFTGENGLGELAGQLQQRVREPLRVPDVAGAVHLIGLEREFTGVEDVPERTWMLAFGWHMHPLYDLRYDFPYHRNIRPLFVSFHVNRLDMLTEDALAYLRRYGPVGCRDWTTVFLLLSAGVDAFFTGCLTTTVSTVFPDRDSVFRGPGVVGVIDLPPKAAGRTERPVRTYTHQDDAHRHMSLAEGVRAASDMLADYQRDFARAVSLRLHAYLPLVSLGVPTRFQPAHTGDVRLPGLADLAPGCTDLARCRITSAGSSAA